MFEETTREQATRLASAFGMLLFNIKRDVALAALGGLTARILNKTCDTDAERFSVLSEMVTGIANEFPRQETTGVPAAPPSSRGMLQ